MLLHACDIATQGCLFLSGCSLGIIYTRLGSVVQFILIIYQYILPILYTIPDFFMLMRFVLVKAHQHIIIFGLK